MNGAPSGAAGLRGLSQGHGGKFVAMGLATRRLQAVSGPWWNDFFVEYGWPPFFSLGFPCLLWLRRL